MVKYSLDTAGSLAYKPASRRQFGNECHTPCGSNSAVECNLAKVDVAGSIPVSRSKRRRPDQGILQGDTIPEAFGTLRGSNSAVECNLAKVDVAGSLPVSRSKPQPRLLSGLSCFLASCFVQGAGDRRFKGKKEGLEFIEALFSWLRVLG